jgi:hypothetical protein
MIFSDCFVFYYKFVQNIYNKKFERGIDKIKKRLHLSTCFFWQILIKIEISQQIFKLLVNSEIKIVSGNRIVPSGRTDRQTYKHYETNFRFSQICERASTPIQNPILIHNNIIYNILYFP